MKVGNIAKIVLPPAGSNSECIGMLIQVREVNTPLKYHLPMYRGVTLKNNKGYSLTCWFSRDDLEFICENKEKLSKLEKLIYNIQE